VLSVGDGVADDVLEEDLEHAAGLLVDEPGDALDAAPPSQPPNRRLSDALDVIAEHLPVALGAALAQTLAALAAPRHLRYRRRYGFSVTDELVIFGCCCVEEWMNREGTSGRRYIEEGDEWEAVGCGGIRVRSAVDRADRRMQSAWL
jgi:hypothetical protein